MNFTESENVELKETINADFAKEVIAFANAYGGTIYIGVQDNGTVIGVDNIDLTIQKAGNIIRDTIKPDITMFVRYNNLVIDDKIILAISIQKGTNCPYYLANKGLRPNGVYVRQGTSAAPATDTAIRKMIKDTDGDSYEERRSLNQALTFNRTKSEFDKLKLDFNEAKQQTLKIISSDGIYSNLGLLLSDQCPFSIKTAIFSGTSSSTFLDRKEFTGPLFSQLESIYEYLNLYNKTKATFDKLYRIDKRDYPEEALREALLNAIVHRDYSISDSTIISMYSNRIEFVSIGGLCKGMRAIDLNNGNVSICRNSQLASVFYRLKLIEAYGIGLTKIYESYEGEANQPKIVVTENVFRIILPNRNVTDLTEKSTHPIIVTTDTLNISEEKSSNYEENTAPTLTPNEQKILNYLNSHEAINRPDIEALLLTSQATANRTIKKLLDKNLLLRKGRGPNTTYTKK